MQAKGASAQGAGAGAAADGQYYYKLMASYLSKRNCDESFVRYFLGGKSSRKTPDELERADERKRRLQRERSRRYRALKNARRHRSPRDGRDGEHVAPPVDSDTDDSPPTLCEWSDDSADPPPASEPRTPPAPAPAPAPQLAPRDLLAETAELDFPALHSLMLQWLQT